MIIYDFGEFAPLNIVIFHRYIKFPEGTEQWMHRLGDFLGNDQWCWSFGDYAEQTYRMSIDPQVQLGWGKFAFVVCIFSWLSLFWILANLELRGWLRHFGRTYTLKMWWTCDMYVAKVELSTCYKVQSVVLLVRGWINVTRRPMQFFRHVCSLGQSNITRSILFGMHMMLHL